MKASLLASDRTYGARRVWRDLLLLMVTHNGPTMFARIGMMKALNRNVERAFNPSRKETHWGKRKLKRDQ